MIFNVALQNIPLGLPCTLPSFLTTLCSILKISLDGFVGACHVGLDVIEFFQPCCLNFLFQIWEKEEIVGELGLENMVNALVQ